MNLIYIDKLTEWHNKEDMIKSLYVDEKLDIEFIYKSDFNNTKDLRDFIESICVILWFPDKLLSRVILISDELNNNAIEYWTDKEWFNILRIISRVEDWVVNFKLEVEDNWKWRLPKNALDMETLRAHRLKLGYWKHNSIRWRGLFLIIVKLVERLYFRDSEEWGLIVWIKMKI